MSVPRDAPRGRDLGVGSKISRQRKSERECRFVLVIICSGVISRVFNITALRDSWFFVRNMDTSLVSSLRCTLEIL